MHILFYILIFDPKIKISMIMIIMIITIIIIIIIIVIIIIIIIQESFVVVESRIKHLKENFGFIQEIKSFQKIIFGLFIVFPSGIYMFKVSNRNTRTM